MNAHGSDIGTRYDEWMQGGAYTDEEASLISGLQVRAMRELHQLGALTPLSSRPGRGNKRLWDRHGIIKATLTAAVMVGGYSLPISARIATAWTNSYFIKDAFSYAPDWAALQGRPSQKWAAERHDGRKVIEVWLSDEFAGGEIDLESDAYLEVIDGEHLIARTVNYDRPLLVGISEGGDPERAIVRLGRLVDGGASLVGADFIDAERPLTPAQLAVFDQVIDGESVRDILRRFDVENLSFLEGGGRLVDPGFLGLKEEARPAGNPGETKDERLQRIESAKRAEETRTRQILLTARTVLSINMTLAQRLALRRMLKLSNGESDARHMGATP